MGHRVNVWIQRLIVSTAVIIVSVLNLLRVRHDEILIIVLSLLIAAATAMILADPGPRTKGLVEKIRHRVR